MFAGVGNWMYLCIAIGLPMDSFCTSRRLLGGITLLLVCWYCHVRWQVAGGGGMLYRGLGGGRRL